MIYEWQEIDQSKILNCGLNCGLVDDVPASEGKDYAVKKQGSFSVTLEISTSNYTTQTVTIVPRTNAEHKALVAFSDRLLSRTTLAEQIDLATHATKRLTAMKESLRSELKLILQAFFPDYKAAVDGCCFGSIGHRGTITGTIKQDDYFFITVDLTKESEHAILKKFYKKTLQFATKFYKSKNLLPIDLGHVILK